jgi:hypothetical protein
MFATLLGDASQINQQMEKYQAVTVERVNDFVRDRLGRDNRAILIYVPRAPQEIEAEPAAADSAVS